MITDLSILLEEIEEMKQKVLEEYSSNKEIDINAYETVHELGYVDVLKDLVRLINEED